jgi:hypothetical protein
MLPPPLPLYLTTCAYTHYKYHNISSKKMATHTGSIILLNDKLYPISRGKYSMCMHTTNPIHVMTFAKKKQFFSQFSKGVEYDQVLNIQKKFDNNFS